MRDIPDGISFVDVEILPDEESKCSCDGLIKCPDVKVVGMIPLYSCVAICCKFFVGTLKKDGKRYVRCMWDANKSYEENMKLDV